MKGGCSRQILFKFYKEFYSILGGTTNEKIKQL